MKPKYTVDRQRREEERQRKWVGTSIQNGDGVSDFWHLYRPFLSNWRLLSKPMWVYYPITCFSLIFIFYKYFYRKTLILFLTWVNHHINVIINSMKWVDVLQRNFIFPSSFYCHLQRANDVFVRQRRSNSHPDYIHH